MATAKDYIGCDYGHGTTNIDLKTGIRYGVVSQYDIMQAWCDDSEPVYPEVQCDSTGLNINACDCDECQNQTMFMEPIGHRYESENYIMTQGGDDRDIFVIKSPFYTLCGYCSPCCPGAGDLSHPTENGVKAYCPGHDWFDGGVAPYPIYSTKTGELVNP